jgi:phi LC3 family holin
MKINWKVRLKNPYFWIGLAAVILTAVGAEPEMFTSWTILFEKVRALAENPFLIGCTVVAVIGYLNDPTTAGINDSQQALMYEKPKK